MLDKTPNNKESEYIKKEIDYIATDIRSKAPNYAAMYDSPLSPITKSKDILGDAIGNLEGKTKPTQFSGMTQNELYADLSDNTRIAKFDLIPKNAETVQDIEKYHADNQTTGEKWGNGTTKFLGKTLASIVGGTVGSVNGIIDGVKNLSFEASYNNDFNDWLDDLNTKMDYKLPNYYSEQEKSNNFLQSMGTANFWANDVLGAASFTVGLIASEAIWGAATGGTSLGTTFARNAGRVGKLIGRNAEIATAANTAIRTTKAPILSRFLTQRLPQDMAIKAGKLGDLINTARFTYTSAGYESGQEARHYMREATEDYNRNFEELNGRAPSMDEYAEFNDNLTDSGNALFGFNMAVVGSSNLAIFGKTLGINSPIKFPSKWSNKTFFGIGSKLSEDGALVAIKANRAQNIFSKTMSIAKTPLIEGLYEEGLQSVGNNTGKNWIESAYNPKHMGETMNVADSFIKSLDQTYTTKEGWKEIGIGMIVGLFSGTGIGVASGQGLFAEHNAAKKYNEQEIENRNTYTVEKTLQRIHTANRVLAFNEAGEAAEEKGDIVGAELSRTSAMVAHLNGAHNFGYTAEAIEEFNAGVNSMDNATLMKQYGLKTEAEAEAAKETIKAEFSELSEQYTKQREYVDYMINSRSKEFKGKKNIEEVKEAIAFELTLGHKSHELSGELLKDLQESLAKTYNTTGLSMSTSMEVQDVLWSAGRESRRNFKSKQDELRKARNRKDELEKKRLSLEKNKNKSKDNTQDLDGLNSVVVEIQENIQEVERLNTELEGLFSAAQLQNPFSDSSQNYITAEELMKVDENLKDVGKLVEDFKKTNPREGYRLEGVLKEYQKSKIAFTRYADLSRQLQDPNLGLRGKRNIISELSSEKDPNEITVEFMEGMVKNMDRIKLSETLEQTESTPEAQEILRKSRMKAPADKKKVSSVQDILEDNPYLLEYTGNESNISRPTEEEVAEYKKLANRVRRSKKIDNEKATRNKPNYYAKKGIPITLTVAEMTRFQELNQLMSDWRLYESAVNGEQISIANLVEQEISREEEIKQDKVVDEITVDDFVEVVTPSEAIPNKNGVEFRKSSIIQTYENVKVMVMDKNYQFSHLKLASILSRLPGITKIVVQEPIMDENGVPTKWQKAREVTAEEAITLEEYGTKFTLMTPEGNMQVSRMDYGRLQIPMIEFIKFKKSMGLDVFKQATTRTSYSDLYEVDENGEMTQKESDFGKEDGEASYEPEEILSILPGTSTFFKVNIRDPYNSKLKEKFESEEITYEQVINQVKVYNVGANNKVLGDLKSNKDIIDESDNFLDIRRMAADVLITSNSVNDEVTIPYTAKSAYTLLGTPNVTMVSTEDGAVPKSNKITPKALGRVVDYGFMENGILKLKGDTQNVRLDFVSKLAKKVNIPVIVFKEGQYLVAYPVSLTKTNVDKVSEVNKILNSKMNRAEKATLINAIFAENGMTPSLEYKTAEDQNMYDTESGKVNAEVQGRIDQLAAKEDFVDVVDWLEPGHDKNKLMDEVTVTLNLEERALKSPKLIVDFKNAERNDKSIPWYDVFLTTGETTEEQINILANKVLAMEPLTPEESDLYNNKTLETKEAVKELIRVSDEKQAEIQKNKNENC